MKIRRFSTFVICALLAGITLRYAVEKSRTFGSIAGHTTPLKDPIPAYTRALRPNYPYSIIAGGAYSAAELRFADQQDPLVKEHYADFNLKDVQMVRLTEDRYQYASYRLHQKVYWTKKKLRIPKGELLLTDGSNWARARCGNRLSAKPHATQVSDAEPPEKALSMPPMHLGMPMELAKTPPLGGLSSILPASGGSFPPVLPPNSVTPPAELPPLVPVGPATPVIPIVPILFPPITPIVPNTPIPPGSPLTPPVIVPPGGGPPPTIPPPTDPPLSSVPEPTALYLFLVTFVLSLYGLTRMMSAQEKTEPPSGDEKNQ